MFLLLSFLLRWRVLLSLLCMFKMRNQFIVLSRVVWGINWGRQESHVLAANWDGVLPDELFEINPHVDLTVGADSESVIAEWRKTSAVLMQLAREVVDGAWAPVFGPSLDVTDEVVRPHLSYNLAPQPLSQTFNSVLFLACEEKFVSNCTENEANFVIKYTNTCDFEIHNAAAALDAPPDELVGEYLLMKAVESQRIAPSAIALSATILVTDQLTWMMNPKLRSKSTDNFVSWECTDGNRRPSVRVMVENRVGVSVEKYFTGMA